MSENGILSFSISILALVFLVGILVAVSITPQSIQENEMHEYAVVFKPGTNHYRVFDKVVESGGFPVRSGAFDFVLIAASADESFQSRLKEQGAVLVFSPFIKGGCFVQNRSAFKEQV